MQYLSIVDINFGATMRLFLIERAYIGRFFGHLPVDHLFRSSVQACPFPSLSLLLVPGIWRP